MKRGGAYYSTVATQLMNAHYNDLGETHVVNTVHDGAVAGWPRDWVLEMPASVDRKGIHPLPAQPLPQTCFGLIDLFCNSQPSPSARGHWPGVPARQWKPTVMMPAR